MVWFFASNNHHKHSLTTIMKRYALITSILTLAVVLSSCTSPLDSDAPRIETPLSPAPKVIPSSVEKEFSFGEMQYAMTGSPTFLVDSTAHPARFWMDFTMAQVNDSAKALIQSFRVKVDSLSADGYTYNLRSGQAWLDMDLGLGLEAFEVADGVGAAHTATVLILELATSPGKPRMFQVTVFLEGNKDDFVPGFGQQQVLGRFIVTL